MTNKEEIIIDGVNVSTCKGLKYKPDGIKKPICLGGGIRGMYRSCLCEKNQNCHFKQLARKTQECEELKRKLSNQEQLYQNELEIYNESCLQLRQENDDLYLERLALNTANSGINSLLEIKEQENDRYRKALEEIKEVTKNLKQDICNNCGWHNTDGCNPSDNVCGDLINILDIINKAKDGE